jgi:hypothetical protein
MAIIRVSVSPDLYFEVVEAAKHIYPAHHLSHSRQWSDNQFTGLMIDRTVK